MTSATLTRKGTDDGLYDGPMAWDIYCEREDAMREELMKSATCLDCSKCVSCGIEGHESIGWCREFEEFMDGSMPVSDHGCDVFAA